VVGRLDLLCDALAECSLQFGLAGGVQHLLLDRCTVRAPANHQEKVKLLRILYLSLRFNGHFPGEPGLAGVY